MTKKSLRLLCLHGKYQNSSAFHSKMRFWRDQLAPSCTLDCFYIDAPVSVTPKILLNHQNQPKNKSTSRFRIKETSHLSHLAWWDDEEKTLPNSNRKQVLTQQYDDFTTYMRKQIQLVRKEIGDGEEIDGIVGFSQGAVAASLLCTKKVSKDIGWAPKLGVLISGYLDNSLQHETFLEGNGAGCDSEYGILPNIRSLHIYGEKDCVIPPRKSIELANLFQGHRSDFHENECTTTIFGHDGGHVIPNSTRSVEQLESFLLSSVEKRTPNSSANKTAAVVV